MTEYADIHNHILFGLDDGAQSFDESMKLIHLAYQNGTRNIIFTPHFHRGRWTTSKKRITETASALKKECERKYPDLQLSLGCEIYYTSDIPDLLENGKLMTMAKSRYILLEFSPVSEYRLIQSGIREVMQKGFLPIIAHVERYNCIRQDKMSMNETGADNMEGMLLHYFRNQDGQVYVNLSLMTEEEIMNRVNKSGNPDFSISRSE